MKKANDFVFSLVKKYFSLDTKSLELFKERLYSPVLDEVFKSFDLDENNRRYWEIDQATFEKCDKGWVLFKKIFPRFVENKNMEYEDFKNNRIKIDKNSVKLQKALVYFYLKNPQPSNVYSGLGFIAGKYHSIDSFYQETVEKERRSEFIEYYEAEALAGSKRSLKEIYEDFMTIKISRYMREVGSYKLPNKKLYLVLSCNFADWLFCSTGNGWSSCLSVNSEYGYWAGLPGLITDTNRAILYLTTKDPKTPVPYIDNNFHLDKMIARTWVLLDSNNILNLVRFYPSSYLDKDFIKEITQSEYFNENTSRVLTTSKNDFPLLYYKDGKSLSIYQDNATPIFLPNGLCMYEYYGKGFVFYSKPLDRRFTTSPIENLAGLEVLVEGEEEVSDYLISTHKENFCYSCGGLIIGDDRFHGVDDNYYCGDCFYDLWVICDLCGDMVEASSTHYVSRTGDLCQSCFNSNYKFCFECGCITSLDNVKKIGEVYICNICVDTNFCECSVCEGLYRTSQTTGIGSNRYCSSCFNNLASKKRCLV